MAKQNPKLSKAAMQRVAGYEAKSASTSNRKAVNRKDNLLAAIAATVAVVIAVGLQVIYFNFGPGTPAPTAAPATVPNASLAENRIWTGSMNVGESQIDFELDGQKAPQAVANFVSLVDKGFYENISCHRLVTEGIFVLQCGDPKGDGTGGPGYSFGPIENAPADNVYKTGWLAMARGGDAGDSMGSQFFIVYADSMIPSDSAGGYTVFGKLTSPITPIEDIASLGTADGKTDGQPANQVLLSKLSVK